MKKTTNNNLESVPVQTGTGKTSSQTQKNKAPIKLELIITVVNKKKAEYYLDLLQSFDVNFQFSSLASGTAKSDINHYLELSETDKIVIFSVARADRIDDILYTLQQKFSTIRNGNGIAVTVPFTSMIGTSVYTFLCNAIETASGGITI